MPMPATVAAEVYKRLKEIKALAKEVEEIPIFGPDLWTMREGDKKCQKIFADADWVYAQVQKYVGTGS